MPTSLNKSSLNNLIKQPPSIKNTLMIGYAITFLIIAIVAAIFGFGGIVAGAIGIARFTFWLFAALFILSFISNLLE